MNNFSIIITVLVSLLFSNQSLWDFGVIIEKDLPITYQREMDINNLVELTNSNNNIKALHSNLFLPPIIQEIKSPLFEKRNLVKNYDDILSKFSLSDKISSVKKAFLNKQFTSFFNFYNLLNHNNIGRDKTINLMYIQNLYFSNQLDIALLALDRLKIDGLSPELLLYKIKIELKLKKINNANDSINYFINKFPNNDLMRYVIYEKKLIDNKYND
tara:strand:- start:316 stop:960 length:645 start_codon:yes stop_codon:yes gene_type:complete